MYNAMSLVFALVMVVYRQLFSCSLEVEGRAQGKEEAREAHFQQVRDLINHYDDGYRRLVR